MPADSSADPPGAAVAGLREELDRLAELLRRGTGVPVRIGDEPIDGDPDAHAADNRAGDDGADGDAPDVAADDGTGGDRAGAQGGLRLQVVRLLVPPYRDPRGARRVDAEVLLEAYGGGHVAEADRVASAMLVLLADGSWELASDAPGADLWLALARPARPGCLVRVPLSREIDRPARPLVREPLDVRGTGLVPVHGRVVAADGTPLAGARVRARPDGRPVTTGHDGRWALTLPTSAVTLDVEARGERVAHPLPGDRDPAADVDIVLARLGAGPAPSPTHR